MRPQTVTLYNALGEDESGSMQWARTVLRNVRYERRSAAVAAMSGDTVTDGLLLFVMGKSGYVEPVGYAGAGWTLRDGDMVAIGEQAATDPRSILATRDVYRITGVEPAHDSHGRFHHFEVSAS